MAEYLSSCSVAASVSRLMAVHFFICKPDKLVYIVIRVGTFYNCANAGFYFIAFTGMLIEIIEIFFKTISVVFLIFLAYIAACRNKFVAPESCTDLPLDRNRIQCSCDRIDSKISFKMSVNIVYLL